ncbi:hypothetical protein FSP39_017753 [Pinctada imbricata]|uniref:DUF4549 domain-containing protein n=1 Tax=Pinctada imbricata TaxID=66713 RepID=A0AA88YDU9_PINIB|nr:hypothetical protein FSP39_017753 [Pinctada imbricata]
MLEISELYKVSNSKRVQEMEKEMSIEIEDLKKDIEDNLVDHIPVKMISSVPLPKSVAFFKKERKLVIDRLLQVSEAQPLKMQAEIMKEEMMSSEDHEYTVKSIPLLLHQYFTDRIQELVQCKHLHMLRWKRFCEHTGTIEALYPLYTKRLNHVMKEYDDSVQRAHRLSAAKEDLLCNTDIAMMEIKMEDLLIYLRQLVCHIHSVKRVNHFLRVIKWLPLTHKEETTPPDKESDDQEETTSASKIASRYQDDNLGFLQRPKSGVSRPSSASSVQASTPIPTAPPINPTLLSTTPLPSSAFTFAAAASGGGLATDESSLGLPLNVVDFDSLKPHLSYLLNIYGINYDLESINNSADEMEMYAAVNRKFRHLFNRQEHMRTFKTYDRIEEGLQNWGSDSYVHALRQESNWLPYVNLKSKRDPHQEKKWTRLRHVGNNDEILKYMSKFIHVSDPEKVQDTLRDHAATVRNPPQPQPAFVASHKAATTYDTKIVWRKIYSNPDLYTENEDENLGIPDAEEDTGGSKSRATSARRRKDSYDFVNTVQMFGLDDGEQDRQDPATVQGAYLSFLHLRHLRLRDLQRTALSLLNYFRSLERTLTINDCGLSQESATFKRTSQQNHRRGTEHDGTLGGGGGLGYHGYVHNTPADYKVSEAEFMEFADVENHDDFYSYEEGRIHVQDSRGYYIVYSAAEKDLENLEKDILLIATHFIEKDRELRGKSKIPNKATESARRRQQHSAGPGDFDIVKYAHQEVDRFGVLLDLWNNMTTFLECKRELIDCYVEAYQHVFNREEKRALAQVIMDFMYRQPRYDFEEPYFVKALREECVIMRQMNILIKNVMDKQIEEQREYLQKVCREGEEFGLPLSVVPKQPVSINLSRPALRNIYMLEFHPSLSVASRIPDAIEYALQELVHVHKPQTVYDSILIEKKLIEVAAREWEKADKLDDLFNQGVQKDLFSEVFVEDPLFMCEIAKNLVEKKEEDGTRKSAKERQLSMISAVSRLLETLTVRYRLMDSALETGVLAKIYKIQATEMGFSDFHMYIRAVQFESATMKDDAGKPPPISMSDIMDDDSAVYKLNVPNQQSLAINELDEAQIGRFSFRTRERMMKILEPGGLENLQVILKVQIVHKNAITSAVLQANACIPVEEPDIRKSGRTSPTETKSEKSSVTQMTSFSGGTGASALGAKLTHDHSLRYKRSPDAFVSIQLEKTPIRDIMLNEFVSKRTGNIAMRNLDEQEKAKRGLISEFCYRFNRRMSQYSLRGQLIAYYNSILRLLKDFPNVRITLRNIFILAKMSYKIFYPYFRKTYFMVGEPNEKKQNVDGMNSLEPDPKQDKKRPRQLLTNDGQHVLNIWFIPHHTEALVMFKNFSDDDKIVRALSYSLSIVSSLHDMLQYLCAHARLGSSHARLGSQKLEFVSADWGGTEGIGAELREIQRQIENLPHPTDPQTISDFLALRRDVMFLEFDVAIRHCMVDTFVSTGNLQSYRSIKNNTYHALPNLSNIQRPTLQGMGFTVPEPLEPRDFSAKELYPWRSFLGRNGPFPLMFWQWHRIEHNIQLSLAGLKDVDRHVANGEILGVTLLMEDVLQTGYQDMSHLADTDDMETQRSEKREGSVMSRGQSRLDTVTPSVSVMSKAEPPKSLSRTKEPLESYKLLKFFLLLWKILEYVKYDWGKRKLQTEHIDRPSLFREYCKLYKTDVLLPVLQSVARRLGQGEMYEGIALETDLLVVPKGASEIEIRSKQLSRLLEMYESHMIGEIRKKIAKESSLVTAERVREDTNDPTDLWKKPVMKESFTVQKPLLAEDFITKLKSKCEESEDGENFVITKEDLNECVSELARNVMNREKMNFYSYTMYYENLLRVHHTLLYQKEQVKQLRDQLKSAQHNTMVDVQCLMASQTHDLLMEVTALRAKTNEMREQIMNNERDVRERVMEEYEDLVRNLLEEKSILRAKLDEFRNELHDDVCEKIEEVRSEALREMDEAKEKKEDQDDLMNRYLQKSEVLRSYEHEKHNLTKILTKMRVMHNLRQLNYKSKVDKQMLHLKKLSENRSKDRTRLEMMSEQNQKNLEQQLEAIKKALSVAEKECNEIRQKLDKELKEKLEKSHEAAQRARSQKQLEMAKQANIEKLIEELEDKDTRLTILKEEHEVNKRREVLHKEKIRKDMDGIKKQLHHERNLKLDAFNRVDDLQGQVYDLETCYVSRTQSAMGMSPAPTAKSGRSRIHSATKRSVQSSRGTSSGVWPPPIMWPANRSLTPGGAPPQADPELNNIDDRLMQRPKTVGGRLRSRIAEQLLNELELDHHRTIVQLEELQLESGKRETNY